MVDVTVTATEVLSTDDTQEASGDLGATVAAGEVVYLDSSTGTYKLADTDVLSLHAAKAIALNGGGSGQPVRLAVGGKLDPGFTVALGEIYVLSGDAGKIAPVADLANTDYTFIIGIGVTTSSLLLIMKTAGVIHY